VDPAASGPTGYGVIETNGRTFRVLRYGALRIAPKRQKSSAGACLHDVHTLLWPAHRRIFTQMPWPSNPYLPALNMRTALRLAEVRGVVLLAAEQHGVEVRSYSPRELKACVAGYGHADKKQMQLMVRALLKMEETPEPSDAARCAGVALCHIQGEQFAQRFGLSTWPPHIIRATPRANSASAGNPPQESPVCNHPDECNLRAASVCSFYALRLFSFLRLPVPPATGLLTGAYLSPAARNSSRFASRKMGMPPPMKSASWTKTPVATPFEVGPALRRQDFSARFGPAPFQRP